MTVLARLGAMLTDAALGLPLSATPYTVERDLAVPVPDGVTLLGDLYRPAGGGSRPVVLVRTPYGRSGPLGLLFGGTLARRGLQVFLQSTRGTFGSGGQFRPFTTEHEDGLATLTWVREQPWCDGRVAMTGASYFGHTQWAVAPYADPPLVSVSPHITASRVTTAFYDHGVPELENALNWSATIGKQESAGPLAMLPGPGKKVRFRKAARRLPLQAADTVVAGAPVAFWRDFVEHAGPSDPFWAGANHDHVDMARMPPVNMVTGWWDLFLPGQLTDYAALRAAGVPARLTVGPWLHGAFGEMREVMRTDATWLSHHLDAGPPPKGAPVRVFLQGARTWLEFDQWPPVARTVQHFLRSDGTLGPSADDGSRSFTYDPADPTPSVGGPLLQPPGKQADNRDLEARPDVLVHTGAPLPADADIVGPVSAQVQVRTSRDADLFVRLCDVDPNGVSRNVVDGIRRLSGTERQTVEVELFPTAYRVRAGHRIRVQVSGGAFPRFARNLGTPFGTSTALDPCDYEISGPSSVVLPLLP